MKLPYDGKLLLASPDQLNEFKKLTDEEYHGDKARIGSTTLRKALQSPKAFYYEHFLAEKKAEESAAFRFGKIVHKAILEGSEFLHNYVVEPEFVGLTKDGKPSTRSADAKAKREEWAAKLPSTAIVVTQEELDAVHGMLESIGEHEQAMAALSSGVPEQAGYFTDPETGLALKIKPDFLSNDYLRIVDVKTTQDCSLRRFGASAFEYGYDLQLAFYCEGVKQITGVYPEMVLVLAIEKKPPYEVAVYFITPDIMEAGKAKYIKALQTVKKSLDSNVWPMRQTEIEPLYIPQWVLSELTM